MRTIHSTRDLAKIGAFQVFTSKIIYSRTQLLNIHADATYVIIIYFLFGVFLIENKQVKCILVFILLGNKSDAE